MREMPGQQLAKDAAVSKVAAVLQSLDHSIHKERIKVRRDAGIEDRWLLHASRAKRRLRQLPRQ
jgi:hypothetical protein